MNNASGKIVAISVANEDCKSGDQPRELKESQSLYEWGNDGWLVPATYYDFFYPIKTSDFQDWLKSNPKENSAFTAVGHPKLQYLCNLSSEHAKHILEVSLKLEDDPQVRNVIESALELQK